jgi:hypothetical protein
MVRKGQTTLLPLCCLSFSYHCVVCPFLTIVLSVLFLPLCCLSFSYHCVVCPFLTIVFLVFSFYLSCNVKKSKTKQPNYLKIAEISVVLIISNGALWEVHTYTVTVSTLSVNTCIKLICTSAKQARKARQRFSFLPVSKARSNKCYICQQCMYIVYIIWKAWTGELMGRWANNALEGQTVPAPVMAPVMLI